MDPAIVFVVCCFLAVLVMTLAPPKKVDLDSDLEYIMPFQLLGGGYVTIPPVLNRPV